MKKLVSLMAITVAVMLIALPLAYAQGQQPRPEGQKTFEGQLTNVDAKAQTISVKGNAGDMTFRYTEQTQVVGGEKDVQGLATKSGATVIVTYQDAGNDNHVATRIQIAEAKK
jgi:hypothetical protein